MTYISYNINSQSTGLRRKINILELVHLCKESKSQKQKQKKKIYLHYDERKPINPHNLIF